MGRPVRMIPSMAFPEASRHDEGSYEPYGVSMSWRVISGNRPNSCMTGDNFLEAFKMTANAIAGAIPCRQD